MTVQQQQKPKEKPFGFINVHKPKGITSHDVVNRVRKLVGVKQVGHGGTLDPLAEGVLPVAVGQATRLLRFLPQGKTYVAGILLGQRTTTDDIEGDVIQTGDVASVNADAIHEALKNFRGEIDQIPPIYSAIHVDGKRLYELARAGNTDVEIKPRRITIHALDVLKIEMPVVTARVACSSGTYIRSIARDLGEQLGCAGCLQSLIREQAGLFWLDKATSLDELTAQKDRIGDFIVDPVSLFAHNESFNTVVVDKEIARKISMGQLIPLSAIDTNGVISGHPVDTNQITAESNALDLVDTNQIAAAANSLNSLQSKSLNPERPIVVIHDGRLIALCNLNEDQKLKPDVVMTDGQLQQN